VRTCPYCQKENDPNAPRCWSCHQFFKPTSFIDEDTLRESIKPVAPQLESITRERYLVLANLANNFIIENEQRISEGEFDTFLELLQTLWRMKK